MASLSELEPVVPQLRKWKTELEKDGKAYVAAGIANKRHIPLKESGIYHTGKSYLQRAKEIERIFQAL